MAASEESQAESQLAMLHDRDEQINEEVHALYPLSTSMTAQEISFEIIVRQKPLLTLFLSPIVSILTTASFMSIYYANGSCQDAIDNMEEYDSRELISHAMCCLPEWPISIVGFVISGVMSMYSVPYIWSSGGATGKCCCFTSSDSGIRLYKNSSRWTAIVIGVMSMSIIVAAAASLCVEIYTHGIAAFFLFMGGFTLMCMRICGCGQVGCCKRSIPSEDAYSACTSKHADTLRLWSKGCVTFSLLSLILSIAVSRITMNSDSGVAAESLFAMIGIFAQYSVLFDLVIKELKMKNNPQQESQEQG